ncbi:hypothetical protein SLA2020_526760 [Shorea laevis]
MGEGNMNDVENEFDCSVLCFFVLGSSKPKAMRAIKGATIMENANFLEKFESGSPPSSAIRQEQTLWIQQ